MEGNDTLRLERLERRVAALEEQLSRLTPAVAPALPAAAPAPQAPWPEPVPAAATPADVVEQLGAHPPHETPSPQRPRFDYERFLGLAVLGRIGIAALVLAGGYFAQLGWGHLGPTARIVCLYLTAGAMIALGAWLRSRTAARYIALLWGGATALTYLAGVAARLRYELIGPAPALALLVASAALGQVLARQLRLQSMATVALGGAFAAPILVGSDSGSPTGLFAYLLVLHTWAATTEHLWQWRLPRHLALLATFGIAAGWFANHAAPPPLSAVLHVEALWLGLVAPELLRAFHRGDVTTVRRTLVTISAWAVQLAMLVWTLRHDALPSFGMLAGLTALVGCTALRRRQPSLDSWTAQLAQLGGVLVVLGAFLVWNGMPPPAPSLPANLGFDHAALRVAAVVASGLALFAARRVTGAADLAAALGTVLGLVVISNPAPAGTGHLLAITVLLLPGTLVVRGSGAPSRRAGLWLGALVAFVAVRLEATGSSPLHYWVPIAAGATGLWFALVGAVAARREDAELLASVATWRFAGAVLLTWLTLAMLPLVLEHGTAIAELPAAGLATGAMATLGAALLARAAPARNTTIVALADLGAALIAIGALAVWTTPALPDELVRQATFDQPWPRLLSLGATAMLTLGLRRWTRGGETGALLAAFVGLLLTTLPAPTNELRAQTATLLVVPATLVLSARAAWHRCAALVLGAAALFGSATQQLSFAGEQGTWLSIALGASGGWAALGALRASWRGDRALLGTATTLLVAIAVLWSVAALQPVPPEATSMTAFVNLRFVSALAVLALLETGRRRLPRQVDAVERITFTAIELALAYLAGLVEMLVVVELWPEGWSAVTISLYTLLFAGALLAAGFVRRQPWLRWPGLCGLGIVVVKVLLFDLRDLSTPLRVLATGALGLVLLVSAFAYARARDPGSRAP